MLRVSGLRKSFGSVRAVRDVSFTLEKGRITAMLGENGAGKTTTLKIILGFLRGDAGTVELGARRVGYIPDHPEFFSWLKGSAVLDLTARSSGAAPAVWEARVRDLCEKLLLDPVLLGRRPAAYSSGNAKKFAALQSLALAPELLVVDEPFSALDPPSIKRMRDLFVETRNTGTAVLLSSHMLTEAARISDDVVVLRRGEVAARFELGETLSPARPARGQDMESAFLSLMAG
jgi:ABC-2 type transport system ATP-binding protein